MSNALKIAPPPPRRPTVESSLLPASKPDTVSDTNRKPLAKPAQAAEAVPDTAASAPKFRQVKEDERVQFNKRVTRGVADGFEMLAIRTRIKMPELLAEALQLLEQRYGKVS